MISISSVMALNPIQVQTVSINNLLFEGLGQLIWTWPDNTMYLNGYDETQPVVYIEVWLSLILFTNNLSIWTLFDASDSDLGLI